MEEIAKSSIALELIDRFQSGYPNKSYFNYVANNVTIEKVIAVAGLLAPDIIEVDGKIFIKENYPMLKGRLNCRFGNDKKTLERYVNLFCLSDFFMIAADEMSSQEFWLGELSIVIKLFWSRHLKEHFPTKVFDFEIHKDGLFDESGLCITFSEGVIEEVK
jgi:hypothetical protein